MAGERCPRCGHFVPPTDKFCGRCGQRFTGPRAPPAPLGPRYFPWRFQIDPMWPVPRRDARYVMIVLGIALAIVGILLLVVAAILSSVVPATPSSCGAPPCPTFDVGSWFDWIGLPFLAFGAVMFAVGLWWGLRPTS